MTGTVQRARARRGLLTVVVLLAAILLLDLLYQATGTYREVVWDADGYLRSSYRVAALAHQGLGPVGDIFLAPPEGVYRLPGEPNGPDARGVIREMRKQGPVYPVLLAGVQMLVGFGPERVRSIQAILHVLTGAMLYAAARRWRGHRVGLASLGLFALYLPFSYVTSTLLSENLAVPLGVAVLWFAGRIVERPRRRDIGGLGAALVLLALTRPVYLHLALFTVVVLAVHWLRSALPSRDRVHRIGVLLVAAAIPYLVWQVALTWATPEAGLIFDPTGGRTVTRSLAESYDLALDGFPRPMTVDGAPYRAPPHLDSIRSDPLGSLLLRVEKVRRLWKSPLTVYYNPLVGGHGPLQLYHVALLVLATAAAIATARDRFTWILLVGLLYTTLIYGTFYTEEQRFTFPVMPAVVLLAGAAVPLIVDRLRSPPRVERPHLLITAVAGTCVVSVAVAYPWLLVLVAVPWLAVAVAWTALMCTSIVGIVRFAGRAGAPRARTRLVAATWMGLFVLPVAAHLATGAEPTRWTTPVDTTELHQRFELPATLHPDDIAYASVQVNLLDRDGRLDDVSVRLDGVDLGAPVSLEAVGMRIALATRHHHPITDTDLDGLDVPPSQPAWAVYDLDPRALGGGAFHEVVITGAATTDTRVFGNEREGSATTFDGPAIWPGDEARRGGRPDPHPRRASLWRLQTFGDQRLHLEQDLVGRSSSSRWTDGSATADLSATPFTQSGGYEVRLHIVTHDGRDLLV